MKSGLPFVPGVFFKVLAVVLSVVAVGLVITMLVSGGLETRDIVGSLICAPLLAYLVHLWLTMGKDW